MKSMKAVYILLFLHQNLYLKIILTKVKQIKDEEIGCFGHGIVHRPCIYFL